MKTILFLLFFGSTFVCLSQTINEPLGTSPMPDTEAEFPGGSMALNAYLHEHLRISEIENCTQGKVYLSLIIEADGSVSDARVERGICQEFDSAARKAINEMPRWIPATSNGKPVRTRIILPVHIHFD